MYTSYKTYIWKASNSSVHKRSKNLQPAKAICASSGRSWKSLTKNELNNLIYKKKKKKMAKYSPLSA